MVSSVYGDCFLSWSLLKPGPSQSVRAVRRFTNISFHNQRCLQKRSAVRIFYFTKEARMPLRVPAQIGTVGTGLVVRRKSGERTDSISIGPYAGHCVIRRSTALFLNLRKDALCGEEQKPDVRYLIICAWWSGLESKLLILYHGRNAPFVAEVHSDFLGLFCRHFPTRRLPCSLSLCKRIDNYSQHLFQSGSMHKHARLQTASLPARWLLPDYDAPGYQIT